MNTISKQYFRLRAYPGKKDHYKDFIENNYLAINFNNTEYIFEK